MTLIHERFELLRKLGQGGQAVTWLARDSKTDEQVVVKHLALDQTERWKQIELFEREGDVLESLDHTQVPDYVEAFAETGDEGVNFYLVQEFIDGFTLAEELSAQGTWSAKKAFEDLRAMLELLDWLQRRVPPVIHRDIKPTNIMRRAEDGALVLIDFGAVQLAGTDASFASTFVGTASYMAFEQMSGKALPASDVYSLGVTMCQLLTGVPPSQVEMQGNSLGYGELLRECGVEGRLLEVLERMIQLSLNERYPNAGSALRALLREQSAVGNVVTGIPLRPPVEESVQIEVLGGQRRQAALKRLFGRVPSEKLVTGATLVERELDPKLGETENGLIQDAMEHGFELVQYQQWYAFPMRDSAELWSSPDGVVQIVVSDGITGNNQGVRPIRRLVTTFEDGYQIITFRTSHDPEVSDSHRVVVGTGDFLRDYREHMRAVERYAAKQNVAVVPHMRLEQLVHLHDGFRHHTTGINRGMVSLLSFGFVPLVAMFLLPALYLHSRSNSKPVGASANQDMLLLEHEPESSAVQFDFDASNDFNVVEASLVEAKSKES